MNLKPITAMAALALAIMMTAPASGQGLPLMAAGGEASSWVSDGAGTWSNEPTADTYNSDECSYLETPVLPGAVLAADPTMGFDYTFNLEYSSFSNLAYDGSVFLLSVDAGATWATIASGLENVPNISSAVRNCITSFGAAAPAAVIGNVGQGTASIDLSGVGPTDLFQVRLVLATDFCCLRAGWTVSGITVGGVALE